MIDSGSLVSFRDVSGAGLLSNAAGGAGDRRPATVESRRARLESRFQTS